MHGGSTTSVVHDEGGYPAQTRAGARGPVKLAAIWGLPQISILLANSLGASEAADYRPPGEPILPSLPPNRRRAGIRQQYRSWFYLAERLRSEHRQQASSG